MSAFQYLLTHRLDKCVISVVGLGYVGLPLAIELAKTYETRGFDIKEKRIEELRKGIDITREVNAEELKRVSRLSLTPSIEDLRGTDVFIVTVPTPIDQNKHPELSALEAATRDVSSVLETGNIVVFESTVYPGTTEEVCVPILEKYSGLKFNKDFFVGYSPERINPGDKVHRLPNIIKITSGSTSETLNFVDALYASIVPAGTHRAPSIQVAEAAKVIENTQRDLNIALVNELALIFDRIGLDTDAVLKAAGTKWNFLPFRPGLVGGHCIGVDPYYLTFKAQSVGHHPEIILAARRINDQMAEYIAERVVKMMTREKIHVVGAKILVMGLAFKENCPDIRNTKVMDLVRLLESYHAQVDVLDPWVEPAEARNVYDLDLITSPRDGNYDAIVLAVSHDEFRELGVERIKAFGKPISILFDIKHIFELDEVSGRL